MRKMAGAIFFFCFYGGDGCRKLTKIVFILINVGLSKITWD